MGFARLHAGRTTLIIDAAAPPQGAASANAHAATLAFELTSGRCPLIVNCGSGAMFVPEWHPAGRATPSHSTLALEGYSSSRLGPARRTGAAMRTWLDETPQEVWMRPETDPARHALFGHDGYLATHGLTHIRELELAPDGNVVQGMDTLGAMTTAEKSRFETVLEADALRGIPFQIRFHLHPEVDAALDMGGWAVSMALKSGEIWVFRYDGPVELTLDPSVYLEKGRLRPRATQQIVLSGRLQEPVQQIGWTLAKAQDTPATNGGGSAPPASDP
jgi:uncharacterized heparinase superfamily protein